MTAISYDCMDTENLIYNSEITKVFQRNPTAKYWQTKML